MASFDLTCYYTIISLEYNKNRFLLYCISRSLVVLTDNLPGATSCFQSGNNVHTLTTISFRQGGTITRNMLSPRCKHVDFQISRRDSSTLTFRNAPMHACRPAGACAPVCSISFHSAQANRYTNACMYPQIHLALTSGTCEHKGSLFPAALAGTSALYQSASRSQCDARPSASAPHSGRHPADRERLQRGQPVPQPPHRTPYLPHT